MSKDIHQAIVVTARDVRKKQKAYFSLRRKNRGPGSSGIKVTPSMLIDAMNRWRAAERVLDQLLAQEAAGRTLFVGKDKAVEELLSIIRAARKHITEELDPEGRLFSTGVLVRFMDNAISSHFTQKEPSDAADQPAV